MKKYLKMDMLLNLNLMDCFFNHWQFIPIRVRHDKTYAYKTGKNKGGGNDYKTFNIFGDRYIIQLQIKCYITQKNYQIYKI